VVDQWSKSLPFLPNDVDDMVFFGALRVGKASAICSAVGRSALTVWRCGHHG
jgi:hypothetical protein